MLSMFPIQFLAPLAFLILRVAVALCLFYLGRQHLRYRQELQNILVLSWWPYGRTTAYLFALGEIILATCIFVGASTQIAALLVVIMSGKMLILRSYFDHHTIPDRLFYFLLFAASLSLMITGPGAFAVDLPI